MSTMPRDPRDELLQKYRAKEISYGALQEAWVRLDEQEDDHRRWSSNYG